MKTPILVSLLILAVGGVLGWRDHQRLQAARATYDKVAAELTRRGISVNSSAEAAPVRVTKREREDREAAARVVAVDYIAFAKEKDAVRKVRKELDEAMQKREMDLIERMKSFDPAQWKIIITEVCASKQLTNGTRQAFLYNSIQTFADRHPQAALALLGESPELFSGAGKSRHLISTALVSWSKDDPHSALKWIRENNGANPDFVPGDTKREMVTNAALKDPVAAFDLINGLEIEDANHSISGIIGSATTAEKRTATLTAFRGYLSTIKDETLREQTAGIGIMRLGHGACLEGFDTASRWLASADLTQKELATFAIGLPQFIEAEESGQWIEWAGKILPTGNSEMSVRNLVSNWTTKDFQAAGKWLTTTPAGPTKNVSIRSYAETVSKYEPETAAQWALTLPPGEDREQTLEKIYQNWPDKEAPARQAFAKEHGIK